MEHCPGPSLGDLARSGEDEQATDILCDVIRTLHSNRPDPVGLEPLQHRFAPLIDASLDDDLGAAARLARDLLADPVPPVALHGDLHHDNVLSGPRGWLAIDPKGVWGDPAYEPANTFRNPEGLGEDIFNPDRLHRMAAHFSRRLGLSIPRLLAWAAAHCALSARWSMEDGRTPPRISASCRCSLPPLVVDFVTPRYPSDEKPKALEEASFEELRNP